MANDDDSSSSSSNSSERFACLVARAGDASSAEWLAAEAWEAGAAGVEERDVAGGVELRIYAPQSAIVAIRSSLEETGVADEIGVAERVVEADWSEQWKRGLTAIEVSDRLVIRPSFVSYEPSPGQIELVIDPGQAFGTGGHESTRLVLEWVDVLASELPGNARLLDVGTGTGVLALAAIRLAGVWAIGFDTDPLAIEAARENAAANSIGTGLAFFTGPLEAVSSEGRGFDIVVANLLKNEMLPLLKGIAERTSIGGYAVFAGLLATEVETVMPELVRVGFSSVGAREAVDRNGDRWTALLMRR